MNPIENILRDGYASVIMNSTSSSPGAITILLSQIRVGSKPAVDKLISLVYDELVQLARKRLIRMRGRHDGTLNSTALVNDTFGRLLANNQLNAENSKHFFHIISRKFTDIIVEKIRQERAQKRNNGKKPEQLDESSVRSGLRNVNVIDLREALNELDRQDPDGSTVIHLRYFGGLTREMVAERLGCTISKVRDDEKYALARLRLRLVPAETK